MIETEKVEKKESGEQHVSRAEFVEFARVVHEGLDEIRKDIEALQLQAEEPRDVKPKHIHCSEEGCSYQTDDLGAFVKHAIDERMRKLSQTAPKGHRTVEELTDCPDCFPKLVSKIEDALIERGWEKPQPKPERAPFPF